MWLTVLPLLVAAQSTTTFEDRPALLLSNDKLELTILARGGALARLVLRDDPERINPLWEPIRYARERGQKPSEFGDSIGHFVCVDGFGPVSAEERASGLSGHGEAHKLPWETRRVRKEGGTLVLEQSVKLPIVLETFTRTLRLVDGENVVYVHSELESYLGFDRPVNWAEHGTIGAPFLEPGVTVVDMPAWRARTRPYTVRAGGLPYRLASGKDFTWPMAPTAGGKKVDVRAAPANPNSGDHTTCALDPRRKLVFVTALHPVERLMLGYLFRREDFGWVQSWEHYPPDGRLARGLEFSTQPFDVPRREAIQMAMLFDTPTFRWLPAKSRIESRYLLFWARTPEGMRRVDDVRLEGRTLVIEDRKTRRTLVLAASLGL